MTEAERKLLAKDWKTMYCREKDKTLRLEREAKKRYDEMDEWIRRGSRALLELEDLVKKVLAAKTLTTLQKEVRERKW